MAKKRIGDYGITEKDDVTIEGIVVWSRIGKKVDGADLEREQERARQRNQVPPTKPFYRLTLENPKISQKNPGAPTPLEQYWAENKLYKSASNGAMRTNIESVGNYLQIVQLMPETNEYAEIDMQDKELAQGSRVRAVVRSFKSNYGSIGTGLQFVIVLDPVVKYYERTGNIAIDNYMSQRFGAKKVAESVVEAQEEPVVMMDDDVEDDASAAYDPFDTAGGNPFA